MFIYYLIYPIYAIQWILEFIIFIPAILVNLPMAAIRNLLNLHDFWPTQLQVIYLDCFIVETLGITWAYNRALDGSDEFASYYPWSPFEMKCDGNFLVTRQPTSPILLRHLAPQCAAGWEWVCNIMTIFNS